MKHDTAYRPKHYKRQRPIQPQEMNTQSIIPLLITLLFLHPTTPLPSTPQSWASHKRALMQLQSDLAVGDGNSTATLKPTETTTPPLSTKPTEQQAESLLKLMLASLDHGDVRTIAMKLLPEYTKSCSTGIDCDELQSAMRRLYLSRYSELQLALHRMDKLGLLLRRIQYLAEQGALDSGVHGMPHNHHGNRKLSPIAIPALKRVERRG